MIILLLLGTIGETVGLSRFCRELHVSCVIQQMFYYNYILHNHYFDFLQCLELVSRVSSLKTMR